MNAKALKIIRKFCEVRHIDYKTSKKLYRDYPEKEKEALLKEMENYIFLVKAGKIEVPEAKKPTNGKLIQEDIVQN